MSFYGRRPKSAHEVPAVAEKEVALASIYRRRVGTSGDAGDVGEDGSATVAKPVARPAASPPIVTADVARLRKTNPVNVILPLSRKWLDGLPADVRPVRLAEKYPRLVNLIALEWSDRDALAKLMSELLTDHRGNRKGFAVEILRELNALRAFYYREPSVF